jgi:hypothetical protein
MKQQFTGSVTLDIPNRLVIMQGIELTADRVLLVVNATVGFVYHNFSVDETANVSISAGNTIIEFPPYKDCDTHTNSDKISIFYEDGVDLGKLIRDESNETQTLLQAEFDQTQVDLAAFRTEVKAESDATQTLLQTEFDQTQTDIAAFRGEVKAESDETQSLLLAEFNQTQSDLAAFRVEVKDESDATQTLLETEFNQTQEAIAGFRLEIQDKLNTESGELQVKIGTESANVQSKLLEYKDAIVLKMGQESTAVQDKLNVESGEIRTVIETESQNVRTRLAQHETAVVTKIGVESAAVQAKLEQILIDEYKDAIVDKLGLESLAIRTKLDVESGEIQTAIQTESGNVQGKLLEYKDDIAGTIEAQSTAVQTKLNVESGEIQTAIQTESGNVQGKLLEYKDDIVGTMQAESTAVQTKINTESDEIKQTLETQSLAIQTKLDQILVDDFKNSIVNAINTQGDEIQTKLGVESDEVRTDLTAWRTEVKSGLDASLDATGSKAAPTTNSVAGDWSVISLLKGIFHQIFGKLPSLTTTGRIPVDIGGDGSITVQNEVEISNDVGNPVPVTLGATVVPGDSHSLIPGPINKLAIDLPTGKDAASNTHPSVTVQPVIGSRNFPISGTVTGPLTNTELRAAAVPVTGPLTNTELRAAAVPVDVQSIVQVQVSVSVALLETTNTLPTTSSLVLPANASRRYLFIQNLSSAAIHLSYSGPASLSTLRLDPGASLTFEGQTVPTNAIAMLPVQEGQKYYIAHA